MKERERIIISGLVVLMLILWLGFMVHRSPRFAGSLWGGVLAVSGSALMLVPLAYLVVKRIRPLKRRLTRFVSMRTLLTWHIYAGVLGPILVLLHTGHKFESTLGIALTAMTLLVVLSGFTGRYLMNQFSQTIREKRETLTHLESAYREAAGELAAHPEQVAILRPFSGFFSRLVGSRFLTAGRAGQAGLPLATRTLRLTESMADVEYAIRTHEWFKSLFRRWLKFHIVISVVLYVLLGLHVWAGIYFGLRWFR
ncbi:MAG: hypothetical protein AMXMBFR13_50650 [Phycisphaerae bacterium]